jgi:CubicO group peptidase (beta-lactamase class C family)
MTVSAALETAPSRRQGFDREGLDRLARTLQADAEAGQIPGAVVALWQAGLPLYRCAVGWLDAHRRHAMRPDALFRIFSMTKPLVSVAALQWVERGQLGLDDEVVRHLPAFGHRCVTVRHLLMHTAGLAYGPRQQDRARRDAYARLGLGVHPRDVGAEAFLRALAQAPLTAPPGTQWDYGNATDVLGLVVESVSGMRLEACLQAQIFQPLGMHETAFHVQADDARRLAHPLPFDPVDGSPLSVPDQTYDALQPPALHSGGAGAISTAADYGRFAQALLNDLRGAGRLLQPGTAAQMLTDQLGPRGITARPTPGEAALLSPGYGFGYGFAVRLPGTDANVPGHEGSFLWSGTAGTLFWVDPALDLVAVYMSQAPGASRQHYRRRVIEMVYSALVH